MAGVTESRTYDALLTTTLANYRKQLVDNIFDDYPFLSYINGKLGKAMADQLTTVSKERLIDQVGRLSRDDMSQVERAVQVQLGLAIPDGEA